MPIQQPLPNVPELAAPVAGLTLFQPNVLLASNQSISLLRHLDRQPKHCAVSVQPPHLYSVFRPSGNNSSIRLLGQVGSFSSVSLSQAEGSMSFSLAVASKLWMAAAR